MGVITDTAHLCTAYDKGHFRTFSDSLHLLSSKAAWAKQADKICFILQKDKLLKNVVVRWKYLSVHPFLHQSLCAESLFLPCSSWTLSGSYRLPSVLSLHPCHLCAKGHLSSSFGSRPPGLEYSSPVMQVWCPVWDMIYQKAKCYGERRSKRSFKQTMRKIL